VGSLLKTELYRTGRLELKEALIIVRREEREYTFFFPSAGIGVFGGRGLTAGSAGGAGSPSCPPWDGERGMAVETATSKKGG